jgi:hypothetical protein
VVAKFADKSSVYSNGGDQDLFIHVMRRNGMAAEDELLDCTTLNTPNQLQTPTSFMVHYVGMWPVLRALVTHHGEQMSLELDASRRRHIRKARSSVRASDCRLSAECASPSLGTRPNTSVPPLPYTPVERLAIE